MRPARRTIGAIGAAVVSVGLVRTTAHAAPTSKLTYVRGPGAEACPDEGELRRAVARRVGYDPFFPWAERTVVAQIDSTEKVGFTGQLRIIDVEGRLLGERRFAAMHDCGELVQSIGLAISVAIDDLDQTALKPEAEVPIPREERPPAQALAPLEPPPPQQVDRVQAPVPPRRWQLRTSLGPVGTLGVAPAPSLGAVLGVAARTSALWLGIEGRADASSSRAVPAGGRIATSLMIASVVPCAYLHGSVTPYLCGVGSVGDLAAMSRGVSGPVETHARWVSLGGRVGIEIGLGARWLSVYAQLEAGATLTRHRLQLNGAEVYADAERADAERADARC